MKKNLLLLIFPLVLTSCFTRQKINKKDSLHFIGIYELPQKLQFGRTTVGGLSGIDYSPAENIFYLISDDRSDTNPARFYTAKILLGEKGIDSVVFLNATTLLQKNRQPYPNKRINPSLVPDPEAIRININTGTLVWSSEGERIISPNGMMIINPFINIINKNGLQIDSLQLPPNLHMQSTQNGPRQNGTLEGLAFANNYTSLFAAMEEPLFEDGPRAGLYDSTAWIRIIKYDVNNKKPEAQFAYKIDAVVKEALTPGSFKVNGVPDILAWDETNLLITERSFSTGQPGCNVRLYLANFDEASDITNISSLKKTPPKKSMQKRLLFNLDTLGLWIDNVEGACFGPMLPNGKKSIVLVTDDNFSLQGKTQFLLFQVN